MNSQIVLHEGNLQVVFTVRADFKIESSLDMHSSSSQGNEIKVASIVPPTLEQTGTGSSGKQVERKDTDSNSGEEKSLWETIKDEWKNLATFATALRNKLCTIG